MKIILFISTIFLFQGLALAADKDIDSAPLFYLQGSLGNNSALAMRCVGEAPFREIDCSFTQVSITAVPIEKMAKNKKDVAAAIAKETQIDIDKFKKGIDLPQFLQNMKTASPEQRAFMQDFLNIQRETQNVKDKSSLAKVMGDFQDFQGATCTISQRTFDHHFTRVSKNKWLYNPGPDSL
jgi:hypothetical protein